MDERQLFGREGEALAAAFLQQKGYQILARNWRCRLGEIDIIAVKQGELVFVEVKSGHNSFFNPLDKIDQRKKAKLTALAQYYLDYVYQKEVPVRFDAVSVLIVNNKPKLEHYPGILLA